MVLIWLTHYLYVRLALALMTISFKEEDTPSAPTQDEEAKVYVKDNKLIIMWDDGGTVRYKYLDLTGTGVTWTHTTSAP